MYTFTPCLLALLFSLSLSLSIQATISRLVYVGDGIILYLRMVVQTQVYGKIIIG